MYAIVLISLVYVLPVGVGVSLDDRAMLATECHSGSKGPHGTLTGPEHHGTRGQPVDVGWVPSVGPT